MKPTMARCIHGAVWFKPCPTCDAAEYDMLFEAKLKELQAATPAAIMPAQVTATSERLSIRYLREWDLIETRHQNLGPPLGDRSLFNPPASHAAHFRQIDLNDDNE